MVHDNHAGLECLSKVEGTADRFLLGHISKCVHSRVPLTNCPVVADLTDIEDGTLSHRSRGFENVTRLEVV